MRSKMMNLHLILLPHLRRAVDGSNDMNTTAESSDATPSEESSGATSDDSTQKSDRKKRAKQPSDKASGFDEGYRMDNMGETFEVYLDSRNRKRWKRLVTA